ncbi:cyclase family protein [Elioraea sp. Yellowstone]|jgi:kynurenine formamidase|uniref:cyclase family protein n=1 Tax=Elioraea sp. Yellowstone TaxID=2592070 RepID=UPI0011500909|nr:cyclase family protein [Elioraea sp. Yellowstone]TQF77021.1 cyclase family protein [Elioraea sp. Yellowstone]
MSLSRRLFAHCLACAGLAAGFRATAASAQAPWSPPPASERCPSKWGAADTRGAMNLQTAEQVRKAAALIRTGRVVELGQTLESSMPFFGTRRFDVHLKQMFMNPQANRRGSNEEIVITEIGQVGTQLDAFPHQTIGDETYNCVKVPEISSRGGLTRMGVDGIGQVFTRGVLIDVAGLKGVRTLEDTYEITVEDLQQAMARQNLRIERGDVVLIRTGWDAHWGTDNARYVRSCPGIGVAAAEWLIRQEPIILGADNWPVEVAPSKTMPHASLPVHQIALVVNGVHLLENLRLNELAQAGQGEFAFVMQPLKVKGGTGSTVAPTAIL